MLVCFNLIFMKKIFLLLITCFYLQTAFAKKVKFSVNMTGQTINATGVHVSGDFQVSAGFVGDWDAGATVMTRETADTNLYTVIVDIPAFRKYEYKFVNGDQFYEVEFVPEKSRVGYDFNDNRWIFVDSTANDTTFVGAILFGGNAPAGLQLMRYKVDITGFTASANGVHVAGSFANWQTNRTRLFSFFGVPDAIENVYEGIEYAPIGNYAYKFLNGNTLSSAEILPATCATNGNRTLNLVSDTIVTAVSFGLCFLGIDEIAITENYTSIAPNPSENYTILRTNDEKNLETVEISDISGKILRIYTNIKANTLQINRENLQNGLYFIKTSNNLPKKWVIL